MQWQGTGLELALSALSMWGTSQELWGWPAQVTVSCLQQAEQKDLRTSKARVLQRGQVRMGKNVVLYSLREPSKSTFNESNYF